MKSHPIRVLIVLCLLCVTACSGPGSENDPDGSGSSKKDSSTKEDSGKQPWSGRSLNDWKIVFAEMQEQLELADDEEQLLQDTFEQHVAKLQAWYSDHGPTVAEADRAAIQAARDRDLAGLRKIKDEIVPLKNEAMAMHKEMDAAVIATLSDTNRFRWQGYRLAARFFALAEFLGLSDSQRQQIDELATKAAQSVRTHSTPQAAGFLNLEKAVESQVLDAEQRKQYEQIKDDNKLRSLKTYSSFQPTDRAENN